MNCKVKILTFHFVENFGAVMQAFALREAVKLICGDAEIIDYRPWRDIDKYKSLEVKNNFAQKEIKFANFRKNFMGIIGEGFNKFEESKIPQADIFIVGSDQVWNPSYTGFDPAYFLRFANAGGRRISYAASIGLPICHSLIKPDVYERNLKDFDYISVRETEHAQYLEKLLKREIFSVIDPVFLIEKEKYEIIADTAKSENQKYVLLYDFNFLPELIDCSNQLARKNNCGVKYFYSGIQSSLFTGNSSSVAYDGAEEILKYFRDAEAVVTSSYHGVLFSIIFRKSFYIPRKSYIDIRLKDFIDRLDLTGQVIGEIFRPKEISEEKYNRVHDIIKAEKEHSLSFLKEALS
jgi:exonuclease III